MRIPTIAFFMLAAMTATGEERFITTKGEAKVQVPPDFVEISLDIFAVGPESVILKQDIDARSEKVLLAASEAGVAGDDIESSGITVSRQYEQDRNENDVLRGYSVNRSILVKLRDIARYEQFANALIEAKVDEIAEVTVGVKDRSKLEQLALVQASRNARNEANAIAVELGFALGAPLEISEDRLWVDERLLQRAGNLQEIIVTGARSRRVPITQLAFKPHAIQAEAEVWARFEIVPKSPP